MKIAGICFTQAGFTLLQWIQEILQKEGHETKIACKSRFTEKGHPSELKEDLRDGRKSGFRTVMH